MFHHYAAILAASLACLQPGIDPVYLSLLTTAHGLDPVLHGWIVAATQFGMALGSLVVLRFAGRLSPKAFPVAAIAAICASLASAYIADARALLALRGCYGVAMGILYAQAMSQAARERPHSAYGAVLLLQLILSTLVALALPAIASNHSPAIALATHVLVPLAALGAIVLAAARRSNESLLSESGESRMAPAPDVAAWALATASLLFICGTMMVWSSTAAMAMAAGFSGAALGRAVAAGSIAGAITATFVMTERSLIPLPITGLLASLLLLIPLAAIPTGWNAALLLGVVALNIGATAIITRCSGRAAARSPLPRFQYVVALTHSGGTILGPAMGALLLTAFGSTGMTAGAVIVLAGGCGALAFAAHSARLRLEPVV